LNTAELRQDTNKVSEEALKRVQDQGKKAKQAQQDIKKDKDINNKLSNFLSFLLKNIQNNKLISLLYNTFFKVKYPQSNIVYLRKIINTKVIIGIFVPFYQTQAQEYHIRDLYKELMPNQIKTIEDMTNYLKNLAKTYHDNIPLDKESLIAFVTECTITYLTVYQEKEAKERRQIIQLEVAKHLYGK
jgi:hypothetical protein